MRVAVFGAGYAGLILTRKLERTLPTDVELVLVDETGRHLLQHQLHRVVRRPDVAEDVLLDLSDLLDRASLRVERVTDISPADSEATLASGETLAYDLGAICLGTATNFHGLDGVREHAIPLMELDDAERIHAEFPEDGRVVVGGAGLSGIQVAGELAELARERDASTEVVLLEQEPAVAPGFPPAFQDAVATALADEGVIVETGAEVDHADDETVVLKSGTDLSYDQFVWTGGIAGIDAIDDDRPVVRRDLRLTDSTFVAGDAARVVDADGQAVPASAQTAIAQGRAVGTNLTRLAEHGLSDDGGFEPRLTPYVHESRGWLVSVGDHAVAQVGPQVLTGKAAKAVKTGVGARYLSNVGATEKGLELLLDEFGP
ncbi:FAD-dependent oxidoreductase [Haloarculaceae archaeon H-GB11]|nr:FAD-dependent oxidoreductase [Haloarculaceae archaeon H-GB11]